MLMKLSFNTWPYASFPVWLPAYPLEEVIKRIANIGYDGIEIGAASPHAYPPTLTKERRKDVKKILDHYGLELSSMLPALSGGPGHNVASPIAEERRHTIEHYKDLAELCSEWGGKTLLYIPGWQVFGTSRKQAWEWSKEALTEIANTAKDYGVTLVVEPTPFDSNLVDRCDDALELMEEVNQPNVKVMFDTFHALYRKEVSSDYIYQMGNNLAHMHISDNDRLAPGQGRGDFHSVIKALKDINYDGYLAMEIGFDRRDIEPDLVARQAHDYLRAVIKEVESQNAVLEKI
ncbi:sugar phosphate isomerase/epimerase [Bacillus canaveralius]|uniref:Sugar phosphate isomerase/epimerase n=1 Tax=Bacillus canaveralius TaxID=1403243 RepID=A0A2N5GL65_9BACI|nr:sugar phosphate isomerase/epimerase [Bacillus canaveralius]PLR82303.1 sugar phosphate isomerase/epimerase [Bacillus canaveralius]PLR99460.1 sugar phosphate isomerase/epimerase [Bacillus canaveralius]RSK49103.1 sugar phosphate isomerase/epimerase [Bacillus canaveralius]